MDQDTTLEQLVLGAFRQMGGWVDPPAYGIYETLLPDEVAARWEIAPHQRLTFNAANSQPGVTFLHYGHVFVEAIVNELRGKNPNGQFFINNVRLEKPGLYAVIEKATSLPNAKMFPVPGAATQVRMHHYACFNFKVSLIADEKRELILPVWMDVQRGCSVTGADIERVAILDTQSEHQNVPSANVFWINQPPLVPQTLAALLERIRQLVPLTLDETLAPLQKRLGRFLELDRARLTDYYADLLKDAERRLRKAEDDRRNALESKITAIAVEREAKLADAAQKYHLRIQLELLNLAIIALPKLDLTVEIRKRAVTIKRVTSWNPLLHGVESLCCDVCGQAGQSLFLCENGHLAHTGCLAPQCVDCKRTYCQKCAHEVQACAVCERPVCVNSLVRCVECKRSTCREHGGACHADQGQPRKILPNTEYSVLPEAGDGKKLSTLKTESTSGQKTSADPEKPNARPSHLKTVLLKPLADIVEVYADPMSGTITAYAMVKKRNLCTRRWKLVETGIAVYCRCEKGEDCQENGLVYLPRDDVDRQANSLLAVFLDEYRVPENKVRYFQIRQGNTFNEKKLKVPSSWKDPAALEKARLGFENLKASHK